MTTIEFGGGPSVEQRRGFAGIKDGAHVPGYRGYCPQLKYRVGKTFGEDTHELAGEFPYREPMPPILPRDLAREVRLPSSTGDNKYTEQMVPGYTGYIPRMPFRYGSTYKEDCDACLGEYFNTRSSLDSKMESLRGTVRATARLPAQHGDPAIRDHLNTYRDTHPSRPLLVEDKRPLGEPPIPGYNGYVPRIYTTEQGLGVRYNRMTANGLDLFLNEQAAREATQLAPININQGPSTRHMASYARRLYPNDGMIPKYTGYVPQRRFNMGNTYGDTTRSLEVCAHNQQSFGDFMATKDPTIVNSLA